MVDVLLEELVTTQRIARRFIRLAAKPDAEQPCQGGRLRFKFTDH